MFRGYNEGCHLMKDGWHQLFISVLDELLPDDLVVRLELYKVNVG
jgi:hypothetical protein